jgi:hypothetical protein
MTLELDVGYWWPVGKVQRDFTEEVTNPPFPLFTSPPSRGFSFLAIAALDQVFVGPSAGDEHPPGTPYPSLLLLSLASPSRNGAP